MDDFVALTETLFTPQELEDAVDKAKYEVYVAMAVQSLQEMADYIAEKTEDPYVVMAALETVLEDYKRAVGDEE